MKDCRYSLSVAFSPYFLDSSYKWIRLYFIWLQAYQFFRENFTQFIKCFFPSYDGGQNLEHMDPLFNI